MRRRAGASTVAAACGAAVAVACGPSGTRLFAPDELEGDPPGAGAGGAGPAAAWEGPGGSGGSPAPGGGLAGAPPFGLGSGGSGGSGGAGGAGGSGGEPGIPGDGGGGGAAPRADAGLGPTPGSTPPPASAPSARDGGGSDGAGAAGGAPPARDGAAPPAAPPGDSAAPAGMPTDGLVGYWTFDEGAGTRARDSSGNGNHAELMAGAGWGPGRRSGSSAVALGGARYVRVPRSTSVDGIARGLSIAAWVHHSANAGASLQTVVSRQEGPTNEELYALFVRRDGRVVFSLAGATLEPPAAVPAGRWVHLAATYDGARARLYIDGAEIGARDLREDFPPDTEPLVIGGNLNGPQDPSVLSWEGRLDEVALYNRGLAIAEIRALLP